jgi:hypothetical protein
VADLLTDIRRDIAGRIDELRPARDGIRRLEQARDALDDSQRHPAPRSVPARRTSDRPGGRMTRAGSKEIDRQVLALRREDPAQRPVALAMLTETSVGSMNAQKRKRGNTTR